MNTLAYGLLSLLSRESRSGYDLMLTIQPFWQAKHSQIYPLLAKLETEGYITHVLVEQKDKPDKKVYSITDQGLAALRDWLPQPSSDPVTRDEMVLKAYSLWHGDPNSAKHLFAERIEYFTKRLQRMHSLLNELQATSAPEIADADILSPVFDRYILIRRAIDLAQSELDWCHWVMGLIEKSEAKRREEE